MNQTNTAGFDLDKPPETTDEARAYLDAWHRQNLPHAPFFSAYIKTELAGDFAYHMARWLARRAEPSVTAGDERALFKAHAKRQHLSTDGVTIKGRVVYSNNVTQAASNAWQARAALASPAVSQKDGAAYSAPFTTDVPQCCEDPDNCAEPCTPAATTASASDDDFALSFSREDWGVIFDGVMLDIERSEKRKQTNTESNSDARAEQGRAILAAIRSRSSRATAPSREKDA